MTPSRILGVLLLVPEIALAASPPFPVAEALVRKAVEAAAVPSVAVAIAQHDRLIYRSAFGFADKEAGRTATPRTPYALASATKPIVATAVMILQTRGQLSIDAPVRDVPHANYTVRQLLTHTSGLGTYARIDWADRPAPTRALRDAVARYGRPVQPAGRVCEYSNLGYGVLGDLVTAASGQPLATYLQREIFGPLGMRDASLVNTFEVPRNSAVKYDIGGTRLGATRNDTPGAGNVWASAEDLARFGAFHLGGGGRVGAKILSREARREMQTYFDPEALHHYYDGAHYGLGWYTRMRASGDRVVWHEGGMPGASALLVLLPEKNVAIAVLINATDANATAQEIANAYAQELTPGITAFTFDAASGHAKWDGHGAWVGVWDGTVDVDGRALRLTLTLTREGGAEVGFPDAASRGNLPSSTRFTALVRGDVLLGTLAATLPAHDVDPGKPGYVLLRLVRGGDSVTGALVAYSSAERLEHLYPFAARFTRR